MVYYRLMGKEQTGETSMNQKQDPTKPKDTPASQTPEEFYKKVTKYPNIRRLLERLSKT